MSERFHKLVNLMAALRAPDGCPWDRKQTHESLKPYLLEELQPHPPCGCLVNPELLHILHGLHHLASEFRLEVIGHHLN